MCLHRWIMVRQRRYGERAALLVLLVTLGHSVMALHAQGSHSQDYINGEVSVELTELKRRTASIEQTQQWMFYAVVGGVIGQVLQLLAGAAARRADPVRRKGD